MWILWMNNEDTCVRCNYSRESREWRDIMCNHPGIRTAFTIRRYICMRMNSHIVPIPDWCPEGG